MSQVVWWSTGATRSVPAFGKSETDYCGRAGDFYFSFLSFSFREQDYYYNVVPFYYVARGRVSTTILQVSAIYYLYLHNMFEQEMSVDDNKKNKNKNTETEEIYCLWTLWRGVKRTRVFFKGQSALSIPSFGVRDKSINSSGHTRRHPLGAL